MQLEPGCRAPAAGPPGGTGRSNGVGRLSPAASMRAVVCGRYGPPDVLELQEVETPVPGPNDVLIRIRATTVSSADYRARTLDVPASLRLAPRLAFGLFRPRQPILGSELAGDIEAVGRDVRRFKVGDALFAFSDAAMGCHAEYRCLSEAGLLAPKPVNLSYKEAAALAFGGTTALHYLQRAQIRPGERVLVNGASGAVGTACVQLARHFGAEVTGVCSGANVELVRSLGAAQVIDYTREDFARSGRTYDVIVDAAGTAPYARCRRSLADGGRLLLVSATLGTLLRVPWQAVSSGHAIVSGVASPKREHLHFLAALAGAGELRAVIDRCYPLEQAAEAHRYVATGHKKGNVVLTVGR